MLIAMPAAAQDSRAAELAAQQADKATKLRPNTESGTEKALEWFEGHITDPEYLVLEVRGTLPVGRIRHRPGVSTRCRPCAAECRRSVFGTRLQAGAEASVRFPELAGDKLEIETRVRWTDATQVPFYGVGNESSKDARVNYGLESLEAGALVALKPVPWYRIGAGIALRNIEDRAGVGSRPSIETFPSPPPLLFSETAIHADAGIHRHRLARVLRLHPARRAVLGRVVRLQGRRRRLQLPAPRRRDSAVHTVPERALGIRVPRSGADDRGQGWADRSVLPVADARWRALSSRLLGLPLPGPARHAAQRRISLDPVARHRHGVVRG